LKKTVRLIAPVEMSKLKKEIEEKITEYKNKYVRFEVVEYNYSFFSFIEKLKDQDKDFKETDIILIFAIDDEFENNKAQYLKDLAFVQTELNTKIVIVFNAADEVFLNNLMKLQIHNFYFPEERRFTVDDLAKWLVEEKTIKDNKIYLRIEESPFMRLKKETADAEENAEESQKPEELKEETEEEIEQREQEEKKIIQYIEKPVEVEKVVEKIVYVEKPVEVEKIVTKEKIIKQKDKQLFVFLSSNRSGSSYIISNLAYELEKQNKKVGIFDFDFEKQDLFNYFYIDDKEKTNSLIQGITRSNSPIENTAFITGDHDKIYLYTSDAKTSGSNTIEIEQAMPLVEKMRMAVDITIIDYKPKSFKEITIDEIYLLRMADHLCIVTNADFSSILNTVEIIEYLKDMNILFEKVFFILNMYEDSKFPSRKDIKNIFEKNGEIQIDKNRILKIPYDQNAIQSSWEGVASIVNGADTLIKESFENLAKYFLKEEKEDVLQDSSKKSNSIFKNLIMKGRSNKRT